MKHIVWTRTDDRPIHGQVMIQQTRYTEANEILVIDDGVAEDSSLQMVMKSNVPGEVSLKVLNVKDAIGYLNEDGKHEKIIILVKTPVVSDELGDAGVRPKSISVGGIGMRAEKKPMFKNISVSEEEKEAFRNLLNKGVNVFLRVVVAEPEEGIAKCLQKGNDIPMCIGSSQVVYRR